MVSTKWMGQVDPTTPVSLVLVYRSQEGLLGCPLSLVFFGYGWDDEKRTCLKSSWKGLWVGRAGTAATPAHWWPCAFIQLLAPNNPCRSLATAVNQAEPATHITAGSNDHGAMLEDVVTVTLLIAIGKGRP